jgi:hypothetical protein
MRVLVDTSVWVQHFRTPLPDLALMVRRGEAVTHSVVVGELAVGNLRQRAQTLTDLSSLAQLAEPSPKYVLDLIEREHLFGLGLSWGDVQLLAASVSNRLRLWTLDRRLQDAAKLQSLVYP